jgi:isopenicillin-N epimerase
LHVIVPSNDKITLLSPLVEQEFMLRDLFLLDPNIVFLNHGSFGACPIPVFEKYQNWQRLLESQPVKFLGSELDSYLRYARQELGDFIHASADDIVYIPNATHGVNIIARSLHLNPGDEILSTNHEYGACNYTWEFICNQSGVIYKQLKISLPLTNPEDIIDQFWQAVTHNTKVIFISHIASPTSLIFPVEMICQRAREYGILTIIDGAHAPGQIQIDLSSLQADFYVGNCHKWMLSPKGAGFIYVRPDMQKFIEPLIVSWGYQSKHNVPRESRFIDYLQWSGTKDPSAALSVPAAIEFMENYHWDEVRQNCNNMLRSTMERINEITNLPSLYPLHSNLYHQMGTIPIPRVRDLNEFKFRLYSEYRIEIPYIEWEYQHFLRLSVQGYNTIEEMELLVEALKDLLPKMKEV